MSLSKKENRELANFIKKYLNKKGNE